MHSKERNHENTNQTIMNKNKCIIEKQCIQYLNYCSKCHKVRILTILRFEGEWHTLKIKNKKLTGNGDSGPIMLVRGVGVAL